MSGLFNWPRKTDNKERRVGSGRAFGPKRSSLRRASSAESPPSASDATAATASSACSACQRLCSLSRTPSAKLPLNAFASKGCPEDRGTGPILRWPTLDRPPLLPRALRSWHHPSAPSAPEQHGGRESAEPPLPPSSPSS